MLIVRAPPGGGEEGACARGCDTSNRSSKRPLLQLCTTAQPEQYAAPRGRRPASAGKGEELDESHGAPRGDTAPLAGERELASELPLRSWRQRWVPCRGACPQFGDAGLVSGGHDDPHCRVIERFARCFGYVSGSVVALLGCVNIAARVSKAPARHSTTAGLACVVDLSGDTGERASGSWDSRLGRVAERIGGCPRDDGCSLSVAGSVSEVIPVDWVMVTR